MSAMLPSAATTRQSVPAVLYTVYMAESDHDLADDNYQQIIEVFIESHNVCFNSLGIYHSDKPRNLRYTYFGQMVEPTPLTAIRIPTALAEAVAEIAKSKFETQEKENGLAPTLNDILNMTLPWRA